MNRHQLLARAIGVSVPVLNLFRRPESWPYRLDDLAELPDGSVGRELHRFLGTRNLVYLPKYEVHDAYHALLGYGTTVTEELKLQSFMWGNRNSTVAGRALLLIGLAVFPSKWPLLRIEYRRGQRAQPLRPIPPASLMPHSLDTVRRQLRLV